ncbi:MAG: beta-Ala-His dipeptidase [Selenomonadaceae bacterium]|nr:beta-Ala-His dipeptidase [Selenomonadaceae bacterium]
MGKNSEVLEGVLEEFGHLAAIPRKSGHEQAVSDFLKKYLTDAGFTVVQDAHNNIIADAPASAGYEDAPRTILQCHMDMVCVAKEGVSYDPLHDPIKLHRTDKYLEAVGTSLGSDDGSGVAEGIYILKHAKDHGPLRLIATTDEEVNMTGAIGLDAKYLRDAKYLINCDSENYDELTVGSAGSVNLDFYRKVSFEAPTASKAWKLTVRGLIGGHSGERIGDGRGNAIRTLALAIRGIQKNGAVELASFHGGKAHNAIPNLASAVFATDQQEKDLQAVLQEEKARFMRIYGDVDPDIEFVLEQAAMPEKVLKAGDMERLLSLLTTLHTGVFAMSTVIPGLVETSANLAVVTMDGDTVGVKYFPRSASDDKLDEILLAAETMGRLTGFTLKPGTKSPGWKENKNSRLAKLMPAIFKEQTGKEMKVETIHAGLECGWHFQKNPEIDMVSIGVTTIDIHSPNEKLILDTVEPQVHLILETLKRIAKGQ